MSVIIAASIAYLPPIPPSPSLKKHLDHLKTLAPWGANFDDIASQKNLSVLFSNQSFFSAITPHYFQRAKVTKADLQLVMALCPTFCFFDTLRVTGEEFRTKDIAEALSNIICLRSLELHQTRVDDSLVPRLLAATTLHELRFKPAYVVNRFGFMRPATFAPPVTATTSTNNQNEEQEEEEEESLDEISKKNLSVWGVLKLLEHRDPKMRSSVAQVILGLCEERGYLQDEYTINRLTLLQTRRIDRKNRTSKPTTTTTTATVENNNNNNNTMMTIASGEKKKKVPYELPWTDEDNDDAALPPIDYQEEGAEEGAHQNNHRSEADALLCQILRKLRIRFSKEAGYETETFKSYFQLAFFMNYDVCRDLIHRVRSEDMKAVLKRSEEVQELRKQLEELRKVRDDERRKHDAATRKKSITIINHKKPASRKTNNNDRDDVSILPNFGNNNFTDDEAGIENNDENGEDAAAGASTKNEKEDKNHHQDAAEQQQEQDPSSSLLPGEIAYRNAEEQIQTIQNDFTLPTTVHHDMLNRRASWMFEHVEDCMDSHNTKIREIGYEAARNISEYFPITFIINCYPQIYEKVAQAFPPQTPLPFTELELAEYSKSSRGRASLKKFHERFADARLAQQKYIYDPLRIKHASHAMASTILRAQSMFPVGRGTPIPMNQATLMFVIRYFFKKVSLEKLMSLLIERDVYVVEFTSRLKKDNEWSTDYSVDKEKKVIQESWEISKNNNNNQKSSSTTSHDHHLYEDTTSNNSVVAAALETLVGSGNKTTFDAAEYQKFDFFSSFPEPLSVTTRSIIADVVRLYVPYCMADCVGMRWFSYSIVHLIGSCDTPFDIKTKAIELVRDSLNRDYRGISVNTIVSRFEKSALVEAVCAVFRRLNFDLDPIAWHEAQLFACIAADCLSLMTTTNTIDEFRRINEKCIFVRDDLPDGFKTAAEQRKHQQAEQAEMDSLVDRAIELSRAVAESNFTHPTTVAPAQAIQMQRDAANARLENIKKTYQAYEKDRREYLNMSLAASTRPINAPLLSGRAEANTIRILRSISDARALFGKVRTLIYPELREKTFNPVYLPLLRTGIIKMEDNIFFGTDRQDQYVMPPALSNEDEDFLATIIMRGSKRRQRDEEDAGDEEVEQEKTEEKKTVRKAKAPALKKPSPKPKPKKVVIKKKAVAKKTAKKSTAGTKKAKPAAKKTTKAKVVKVKKPAPKKTRTVAATKKKPVTRKKK